jgi:hypothetical protein
MDSSGEMASGKNMPLLQRVSGLPLLRPEMKFAYIVCSPLLQYFFVTNKFHRIARPQSLIFEKLVMKSSSKSWIAVAAVLTAVLVAVFILKPAQVRLSDTGKLQNGQSYAASCEMVSSSSFLPFNAKAYSIRSLIFSIDGKTRAVPANALNDITVFNPRLPLQVSEEGPVVVISIRSGENEHLVQWRYLNGFFAQRRILNGKEIAIHHAEATLKAPTMVSNISPDAPRRLGSPSLLSTPDESPRKALLNGHE